MSENKVDQMVADYIRARDLLDQRKTEYEESIKPLKELKELIEGWLQKKLDETGSDSIKTSCGTAHRNTKYSASLTDPELFMKHVIETKDYSLLDRKANVTAVKDYVKEHDALPPGCNLSALSTVQVRRPTGK